MTGGVGESQLHSSVNNCFTFPEETECSTALENRTARTFVIGMGYAPVSRRVAFAPKVAYRRQAFGTCSAFCPDYVVEFGLDVTYH